MILLFGAALMLGLVTGLHCVGMCGPLALALPAAGEKRAAYIVGRVMYNLGRAVTYTVMGLIVGMVGQSISLGGIQRQVSIAAGVFLLSILFLLQTGQLNRLLEITGIMRIFARLQKLWAKHFHRRSAIGLFLLGLINGLLPCGPVYVALAAAAATGNVLLASAFMFVFGIGTFPMMLAVSLAGKLVQLPLRRKMQKLASVSAAIVAVLLIVRGLALGIPYLSPPMEATQLNGNPHACCEKH
ncbi:MAG TPA: sulfite exporter TauE/SafE family protein [Kiritimatiellia bacterium]|nr:sulfite exporter TauE/SafE family protein [Kiritimatiellia bacterium]